MRTTLSFALVCAVLPGCSSVGEERSGPRSYEEIEKLYAQKPAKEIEPLIDSSKEKSGPTARSVSKAFQELPPDELQPDTNAATRIKLRIRAWPLYSGDGPIPKTTEESIESQNPGEISTLFYIRAEGRESVTTGDETSRYACGYKDLDLAQSAVFDEEYSFFSGNDEVVIVLKVVERDRIGDQKRAEVKKFLGELGAQAANLYPPAGPFIPIITELVELIGMDLPNIFLSDISLGTGTFRIQRAPISLSCSKKKVFVQNYMKFCFEVVSLD